MAAVGRLFGGGSSKATPTPTIQPAALAPQQQPQVMALRDQNRQLAGMSGTILTNPLGLDSATTTNKKKSLLGQ